MKFKSISVVDACKNLARLATSRKVLDENGDFIPVQIDDTIYEKVYVLVDPKEVTLEDEKQAEEPQPETEA